MNHNTNRREFLKSAALGVGALGATALDRLQDAFFSGGKLYDISLAQWSLNRQFFGGKIDALDFAKVSREEFDIGAIEYVNQFFKTKAKDESYLAELKNVQRPWSGEPSNHGDGEGQLGHADAGERAKTVANHHKWVDAAKYLDCHSIRVNAGTTGSGSFEEKQKLAADGLRQLSEYGAQQGLNVIVENHGGLSSDGSWLAGVMKLVNLENCGTLPDFVHFNVGGGKMYDRYKGVRELMP